MIAEEMFKKLGFFKKDEDSNFICYTKKRIILESLFEEEIDINKRTKEVFFYSSIDYKEDTEFSANADLLKAILKLIEEL